MRTVFNSRRMMTKLASAAAMTCLPLFGGGCLKSFFDQGELARNGGQRLVVPILKSIDPIDDSDTEFAGAEEVKAGDLKTYSVDYVIGRNDLLQTSVMDLMGGGGGVENARTNRVSETGMLTLPLLNEPVQAVGLTEQELQKAIANKYRDAGLLQNAQVNVTVVEARGRTFSALGMVAKPGQYPIMDSDFRVINALVMCGDISSPLVDYLYVVRKKQSERPSTQPATTVGTGLKSAVPGGQDPQVIPSGVDPLAPKTDPLLPTPDAPKKEELKKDDTKAPGTSADSTHAPVLAMMEEAKPAADKPKSDAPATTGDGQDKIITIDGKPVLLGPTSRPVEQPMTNPSDTGVTAATAPVSQPAYEFGKELKADEDVRVIRVPLQQLRNGELRYNIVIRPSDTIIVPQPTTGIYYMGGHVGASGAYGINGNKVTLMQAVTAARMMDPYAVPWKTDIIRRIGDKELFLRVDLTAVFDGRQPDVYIKPNDVITVGTDWYPPFLVALRSAFRISYGFGFIYDRNFAPAQKQPLPGA